MDGIAPAFASKLMLNTPCRDRQWRCCSNICMLRCTCGKQACRAGSPPHKNSRSCLFYPLYRTHFTTHFTTHLTSIIPGPCQMGSNTVLCPCSLGYHDGRADRYPIAGLLFSLRRLFLYLKSEVLQTTAALETPTLLHPPIQSEPLDPENKSAS